MNVKRLMWLLAGVSPLLLSGCISTVGGNTTVGLPFVHDTIQRRYERPPGQVMAAAKDVLKTYGVLSSENSINNSLTATVNTRTVWVRVEPVDQHVTQVDVQARTKHGGGDIDLASQIETLIALRLANPGP